MKKNEIPPSPKRILVIDDEPAFTRMVKRNLESGMHFMVREVNRSVEALDVAREFKPDLIFLDIVMPETDGGDVAVRFRNDPHLRHVPIIFVSAMVSKRESHGGLYMSGGERFVAKPVSTEDLEHCIEATLHE